MTIPGYRLIIFFKFTPNNINVQISDICHQCFLIYMYTSESTDPMGSTFWENLPFLPEPVLLGSKLTFG